MGKRMGKSKSNKRLGGGITQSLNKQSNSKQRSKKRIQIQDTLCNRGILFCPPRIEFASFDHMHHQTNHLIDELQRRTREGDVSAKNYIKQYKA